VGGDNLLRMILKLQIFSQTDKSVKKPWFSKWL